jgi:predicted transcriptional regulator
MTAHLEATQDISLLLGPRAADIMRLLWSRGPATVRAIQTWLTSQAHIAYTTVMNVCARLTEKGCLRGGRSANQGSMGKPMSTRRA